MDIDKIKVQILSQDAFLGTILAGTKIIEDKTIETAATNGRRIFYNPDFFKDLTMEEQAGVFAHEAAHIAMMHPYRARAMNAFPGLWNVAADYVVNDAIANYKRGIKLPPAGLMMPDKYRGRCTEVIYLDMLKDAESMTEFVKKLLEDAEKQGKNCIQISAKDLLDPEDKDENGNPLPNINGIPTEIIEKLQSAMMMVGGDGFGNGGDNVSRLVDKLIRPVLNWRQLLRKYCNEFKTDDYSWKLPSRRSSEYYLPSLCAETEPWMHRVNVYIDVSGSISDKEIASFLSELKQMFSDLHLEEMTIQSFSIGLAAKAVFKQPEKIKDYKPESAGGTEIDSVMEDIEDNRALFNIIFTDGYFDDRSVKNCRANLFWIIYGNNDYKPKKGKCAYVDPYQLTEI